MWNTLGGPGCQGEAQQPLRCFTAGDLRRGFGAPEDDGDRPYLHEYVF